MKRVFLIFLIPFSAFASYDLSPVEDCERLKENMMQDLNYQEANILEGINPALYTFTNRIDSLISEVDGIRRLDTDNDFEMDLINLRGNIASLNNNVYYTLQYSHDTYEYTQYLKGAVNSINCTTCDGSSSSNCCDFTEILQAIGNVSNGVNIAIHELSVISNQLNSLEYTNFLLEHGFGDITNLLDRLLFVSSPTSRFGIAKLTTQNTSYNIVNKQSGLWNDASASATWMLQGLGGALKISIYDMLKVITANSASLGTVVNRLAWIHDDFKTLTNEVGFIHRDTTNFFSFFRGELGVQGVLSDWQSEQVSGSYHDFLTNHYLTVVQGGSLSGNQSSKTNWFSRIETLLAALVFTDSSETNTVDTSAGNTERQQLATSYGTANQAASTFSDDFKTTSQSIVTLYQNYFTTFENASMPSHVVLMRLSNSDPSEELEISFQSDSLGILVDSCRVVTTLCWSSVGIFLLYKFLVWSARCVVVACQFIYRAISSVFKS